MLSVVATALGIVVLVAVPNLRQGSGVLSPNAKRAVRRARQQAKKKPMAAVGGTWRGLVGLNRLVGRLARRIAVAWAPVSRWLHAAMDRLEGENTLTVETASAVGREPQPERVEVPRVVGAPTGGAATVGVPTGGAATVGRVTVGRPRPGEPTADLRPDDVLDEWSRDDRSDDDRSDDDRSDDDRSHHDRSHRGRVTAGVGGSARRSR
jgi:hypothetical protein